MQFPERFSNLPEYAFPRLRALLDHHPAGGEVVHMTIGEPKHKFPAFINDTITQHAAGFNKYPPNQGCPELLNSITGWLKRRYDVAMDAMLLAVLSLVFSLLGPLLDLVVGSFP